MSNIEKTEAESRIEYPGRYLFQKYHGQYRAQPIQLYIEGREQNCRWREDPEVGGGYLESEWHRRDLSFQIEGEYLPQQEADRFLEDNKDLINRILDSYKEEHSGSNWKGEWDRELVQELEEIIEKFEPFIGDPEYLPEEVHNHWFD